MSNTFDLVVIGAGPGGYVAAIRAGQLGMKVACVDKRKSLGGTCLNVGCIPSKTLLHSSEFFHKLSHESKDLGVNISEPKADFARMMQKKEEVVKSFAQGISGLFKKNKVTAVHGTAKVLSANSVEVTAEDGSVQQLQTSCVILATGSEPTPLPFLDFDEKSVLSSTGALALKEVPKKLVVVGGGVIGLELGSVYNRLGTDVTVVEYMDEICPTMDKSISLALRKVLEKQGMHFHLGHGVKKGKLTDEGGVSLLIENKENKQSSLISADATLVSIGRRPFTQNLGLEEAGVALDEKGFVQIDGNFQTSVPGIFAIGDIVDGPMLAHKASEEGVAVVELLAGNHPHLNYLAIPSIVYTWPEVAAVGLTEEEAIAEGIQVRTGKFPFMANSRARCVNESDGFVKVIADDASGRLIGMHIIGPNAGELISDGMIAIEKQVTVEEMAEYAYPHPTLSEATKEACLALSKRAIHC